MTLLLLGCRVTLNICFPGPSQLQVIMMKNTSNQSLARLHVPAVYFSWCSIAVSPQTRNLASCYPYEPLFRHNLKLEVVYGFVC
ncbi:hypothetical protein EDB19DRAFT_1744016 [Suillus lakei]|nr:hypothetical protein EDB19DRAFT_1744016 [Suillus lakei]